jgi:putative membrane-bound dehydrogenase-like protein
VRQRITAILTLLTLVSVNDFSSSQEPPARLPKVLDDRYDLELLASHPEIVTPVGLTARRDGRLLVIESHTHFRPKDYAGPAADRIRLFDPSKPRGEQLSTFWEGSMATMSVAARDDGWVYVATRGKVFRLRDSENAGKADVEETLVRLETKGDYPHNGLCGLAFAPDGTLYFGMGENLGVSYTVIAKDGSSHTGGGEGGNIFRMTADGAKLQRIATGVWNPFGIHVDRHGRIFCVDNDPDARPPCRLLHIVPGADYGFQFRYGRAGTSPLIAWDGELPGTLPMLAGTGEAPCTVLVYKGELWVTSWGDYRLERYKLLPHGFTWKATRSIPVQGDHEFRPVGLTIGADGALYFSDWVDRSYPLHGKGRLWRLAPKKGAAFFETYPEPTTGDTRAQELRTKPDGHALSSADPWERQAAVWGWISDAAASMPAFDTATPFAKLGILQRHRWLEKHADAYLPLALADGQAEVRLLGVRWVVDANARQYKGPIEDMLKRPDNPTMLTRAAIAALAWLEHGADRPKERKDMEDSLALSLLDSTDSDAVRIGLLRAIPPNHPALDNARLTKLYRSAPPSVQRELVWTAALSGRPDRFQFLRTVLDSSTASDSIRADALSAWESSERKDSDRPFLEQHAAGPRSPVTATAQRLLRNAKIDDPRRPPIDNLDAWTKALKEPGDIDNGRRLFFTSAAKCASCHAIDGRGASVGPDLTRIGHSHTPRKLLEAILHPSREVAPHFQPIHMEMADGRTHVGYSLGKMSGESKERFMGSDGKEFIIQVRDVVSRQPSPVSIMPQGLEQTMTLDEMRDLLAYLVRPR